MNFFSFERFNYSVDIVVRNCSLDITQYFLDVSGTDVLFSGETQKCICCQIFHWWINNNYQNIDLYQRLIIFWKEVKFKYLNNFIIFIENHKMREDSLLNFQKQLFLLIKNKGAPQERKKKKKDRSEQVENITPKLPSIHAQRYDLSQNRLTEFQRRIRELQIRQETQQRINQRLFNSGFQSRDQNYAQNYYPRQVQSFYEPYQNNVPNLYKKPPQTRKNDSFQQENIFPSVNSRQKNKMQIENKINLTINPKPKQQKISYQSIKQQSHYQLDSPKKPKNKNEIQPQNRIPKNKKKVNWLRKFRIIGFVVLFTIHYPKYTSTFTVLRFIQFQKNFLIRNGIQYHQAMIAKKFMSRLKKLNKRMKSSEEDNEMPTKELFVLKIGETLTLVKNVLEQFYLFISSEQASVHYEYFALCLPVNFVPDHLFTQQEISSFKINPKKGYTMHSSEEVVKLLLMRNLYMKVLVKCFFQSVANEPDLSKKKLNSWMIYFVCKNYLLKITEGLKNKNWRDQLPPQLIPIPQPSNEDYLGVDYNAVKFRIDSFVKVLRLEVQKNQKYIVGLIHKTLQFLLEKLLNLEQYNYEKIKEQVLTGPYFKKPQNFFYFRDIQKQENKLEKGKKKQKKNKKPQKDKDSWNQESQMDDRNKSLEKKKKSERGKKKKEQKHDEEESDKKTTKSKSKKGKKGNKK